MIGVVITLLVLFEWLFVSSLTNFMYIDPGILPIIMVTGFLVSTKNMFSQFYLLIGVVVSALVLNLPLLITGFAWLVSYGIFIFLAMFLEKESYLFMFLGIVFCVLSTETIFRFELSSLVQAQTVISAAITAFWCFAVIIVVNIRRNYASR